MRKNIFKQSDTPYFCIRNYVNLFFRINISFNTCICLQAIAGPTQSGKRCLVKKLLERKDDLIFPAITQVIWCFGESKPNGLDEIVDKFYHGLPETIENNLIPFNTDNKNNDHVLYVLDDLMKEASKSIEILNSFTKKSHHQNISLIFLMQNFFFRNCRDLTLNCKYACLFKNPRETQIVSTIGRQMCGGKKNICLDLAYKDCCSKPYGYIVLDFSQQQNDACRIRDSLFPENCTIYYNE